MSNLEDTVRSVVQDFIKNEMLFTALDVSNAVKQVLPHAKHREVRDVVRGLFATDIEKQGWARTPITVTLGDSSTAEALLYHPLVDSWDLDNKYDAQKRASTSLRPAAVAQATLAQAQAAQTQAAPSSVGIDASGNVIVTTPVVQPAPAPAPAQPVSARTMWDNLFKTQPSLFPKQ